jgi:hypothetical protein
LKELNDNARLSDEEILKYLDSSVLDDQPTEVLIRLAHKLKERRMDLYPVNQKN